jgi:hypothetical protein
MKRRDLFVGLGVVMLMAGLSVNGVAADKAPKKKSESSIKSADGKSDGFRDCTSAKEFITTYRFLQETRSTALSPADAQRLSLKVAEGCDGAAARFIKTFTLLQKAGIVHGDAINQASDMASKDAITAKTFDGVFTRCFAGDGLDLDLATAVRLARQIAFDYDGNKTFAEADFVELVKYLSSPAGGTMAHQASAQLAARLLTAADIHKKAVAQDFAKSVDYLTSSAGPNLTRPDALQLAEKLLFIGPAARDNFREAYQFAQSAKGMNKERPTAIKLALDVAKLSHKEDDGEEKQIAPAKPKDASE